MKDQDEYSKVIELLLKRSGMKNLKETVGYFAEWLDVSEAAIYNKLLQHAILLF